MQASVFDTEFYPHEKFNSPPRFLNSLIYKGKTKSHQILKINYKYGDNCTFNLYNTLYLFKAHLCPLSRVILLWYLLAMREWNVCSIYCYGQFATLDIINLKPQMGRDSVSFFPFRSLSVNRSVVGFLSSLFYN